MKPVAGGGLNFGRIAKPLRGGGGAAAAAGGPISPAYAGGASAASPLGRVQGEEGRYANTFNYAYDRAHDHGAYTRLFSASGKFSIALAFWTRCSSCDDSETCIVVLLQLPGQLDEPWSTAPFSLYLDCCLSLSVHVGLLTTVAYLTINSYSISERCLIRMSNFWRSAVKRLEGVGISPETMPFLRRTAPGADEIGAGVP